MSPEQWEQVERLLDEALELEPARWPALLDDACADYPQLRREVESLLRRHSHLESFLAEAPVHPIGEDRAGEPVGGRDPKAEAGRVIGAYRVIREIGRGGMGRVFLAERADGRFEQRVALKLLRPGMEAGEMRRRFHTETRILAGLEHPSIARLIDAGIDEAEEPYLVMEYVEGEPIDRYSNRNRLSVDDRLRLFLLVLEAVQHAHANLVVHRDIKPSNILVAGVGSVKLLDFGLAKLVKDDSGSALTTRTGRRWMTPEYAAPEQVRGDAITTATDVYQLGAILYELLTGHRPFENGFRTVYEIERAVLEREPERPSGAVTRTPGSRAENARDPDSVSLARATRPERLSRILRGDLDAIVLRALRKEPADRYAAVRALGDDIERYLAGLPVTARRGTTAYRARKFFRRHRWGIAASAAFAVVLGGFGTVYSVQVTEERDRVRLEAEKSAQVTGFLMGLFEANDPREAAGDSITARALLARGLEQVDALGGQPEVQAEMLDVLGRVYHSLGQYDEALPLLERAVALRRQVLGEEHVDVAESLNNLGRVFREKEDDEAAEALFRDALAIRRALLGKEHPEVAESLNNLAMVLHDHGDFETTERLYREALVMRRTLLGDTHPDVATSLNNLGQLLTDQGRYEEAEGIHREALAIRRGIFGAEHLDVTYSLNNLALALHSQGALAGAERLYRENLVMQRRLLGDEHPEVANTLNNLAALLRDRGDPAAAEGYFREALALRRTALGEEHPQVAFSLHNLASFLVSEGEYEQAESLTREAVRINTAAHGESHWLTAYYRSGLGTSLAGLGRYDEAEELLLDSYAVVQEEVGDRSRFAQAVLRRLVALYDARDEPERAAGYRALLVSAP